MSVLVDKLTSKGIDLIRGYKRKQRELFVEFILPLMQQFEDLHNNYVSAFNLYVDLIANSPDDLTREHPVFQQITKDKILSNDLPNKMNSMWEVLRQEFDDPYDDKDKFLSFLWELNMYITYLGSSAHEMERIKPRGSLLEVLQEIAESEASIEQKRLFAEEEVSEKIQEMQSFYADIDKVFQLLKLDYLK